MSVEVKITGDRAAKAALREFGPKFLNASMNRGLNRVGSAFSREHSKRRLTRAAGFNVTRRAAVKNKKGQPPVAAKARKIGFKGVLEGADKLDGKEMRYTTRSPILIQREKGATIVPRRAKYLAIPQKRGGIRLVRRVRVQATLHLRADWRAFRPQAIEILERFRDQAVERWNKRKSRARR